MKADLEAKMKADMEAQMQAFLARFQASAASAPLPPVAPSTAAPAEAAAGPAASTEAATGPAASAGAADGPAATAEAGAGPAAFSEAADDSAAPAEAAAEERQDEAERDPEPAAGGDEATRPGPRDNQDPEGGSGAAAPAAGGPVPPIPLPEEDLVPPSRPPSRLLAVPGAALTKPWSMQVKIWRILCPLSMYLQCLARTCPSHLSHLWTWVMWIMFQIRRMIKTDLHSTKLRIVMLLLYRWHHLFKHWQQLLRYRQGD
jgi:hypothetical protein